MVTVAPVGILAIVLLFICSSTFLFRVPKLRPILFQSKSGLLGILYKCAIIGTRLGKQVAITTALTAIYIAIA